MTLDAGAGAVSVRFDSPDKRRRVPVRLPLPPDDGRQGGERPRLVRIEIAASDGLIPRRRDPASADPRLLGVFLDLTGDGM